MDELADGAMNCTEEFMGPKRDALWITIPVIIIYALIFITGTIGNISTCIVIARNKSMHTATNYYLFSLAISDLLLLVSGLPQEIYSMYSRYPYIFGSTFCFLRGLFAETSTNATVLTIAAFTVERYLAICHPFLSHTMSKLSRAVKLILGIWLAAVGLALPQAMQFRILGAPDCERCDFVAIIEHSFEVSTILFFVMPMTLITVLYVLIGVRLRASSMIKKRTSNTRVQSKSSRKVVKMLVAVVVAFFICWAPFHAQRLFWKYANTKFDPSYHHLYFKIYEIVTYISGILYYVSATINPVLYHIMSAKFREAFKETFTRCCCRFGHIKNARPQRSYSVLSRSAQRGPDSTDSGRDDPTLHTHTTLTQKSSIESFNTIPNNFRRNKTLATFQALGIEEEANHLEWLDEEDTADTKPSSASTTPTKFIAISVRAPAAAARPPRRLSRLLQYFECLAKRTFDDGGKQFAAYYASPAREPAAEPAARRGASPCDISNSSLRDVETGAIEDELTAYMKEVRSRDLFS